MDTLSLNRFLWLYTWFPLAAVLAVLLLIARFYQRFSGKRTYFRFFLLPIVLFGASSVRYSSLNCLAGDSLGDLLAAAAGIVLVALCINLYNCMLRDKKERGEP